MSCIADCVSNTAFVFLRSALGKLQTWTWVMPLRFCMGCACLPCGCAPAVSARYHLTLDLVYATLPLYRLSAGTFQKWTLGMHLSLCIACAGGGSDTWTLGMPHCLRIVYAPGGSNCECHLVFALCLCTGGSKHGPWACPLVFVSSVCGENVPLGHATLSLYRPRLGMFQKRTFGMPRCLCIVYARGVSKCHPFWDFGVL